LPARFARAYTVCAFVASAASPHSHTVSALHIQGLPWLAIPTRTESATRLFVGTSTDALFVHASPAGCLLQPSPQVGWRWSCIQHLFSPHCTACALFACFGHRRCTQQPNKRTATMTMMRSTIQALALAAMTSLCSAQTPPLPNLPPSFEAWVTCNIVDKNCTLAHSPPRTL
jgi:hypothetical protein